MEKRDRKSRVLILGVVVGALVIALAEDALAAVETYEEIADPCGRMTRRFSRGGINCLTGWLEIPRQMLIATDREGLVAGMVGGLGTGFGCFLVRTCAGVWELVTFPLGLIVPDEPIIRPPTVFQEE